VANADLVIGTQSIAKGMAALLGSSNIRLSSPVSALRQHEDFVEVTTKTGARYLGRKCILAIPSLMYQSLKISPPLPIRLQEITNSSILGDYTKVIVCYDRPWWRDHGHNGFFMSFCGPVSSARDTSVDKDRNYALTCFVNGQFGRDWNKLDAHARRAAVIKQIATVYGVGPESEAYRPIEVFEQIWMHEEYSQGALTPIHALGHYTGYTDVYGKPVKHLHFVGTEYATEWKGYMEGALCSGEKGAAEVMAALGPGDRAKL
jgi:monoamine oxidase